MFQEVFEQVWAELHVRIDYGRVSVAILAPRNEFNDKTSLRQY
jgi:hypothetical protein